MSKWNLIVDVANCTNCQLCVLATHDEHVGNAFPGYAEEMPKHGHKWIDIKRKERGRAPMVDVAFLPVMCQHCDDAPCIAKAENGAVTKRADGIVLIDPEKAKGQKHLVDACPYGSIWWNEDKQVPQHWIFDAHLLDEGWAEPRAVTVCAPGALKAVKTDDTEMRRRADAEKLEQLKPELGTKPRVWYKNLYRYDRCFIGGSVEAARGDTADCVAGAAVTLHRNDHLVDETVTDVYGDFKFDGLEADHGQYRIGITANGFPPKTLDVTLEDSVYLGDIRL